mgnify:CR=1 FL=1
MRFVWEREAGLGSRGCFEASLRGRLAHVSSRRHSERAIFTLEYSPDGRQLVGCGQDRLLLVLDGHSGEIATRVEHAHDVRT